MNQPNNRYKIRKHHDIYTLYTLSDSETDSSVTICPERGAIAVSCKLQGEELFYLDEATFIDPAANIRGGNPVLFPICGQLIEGQFEWELSMKCAIMVLPATAHGKSYRPQRMEKLP